MKIFKKYKKPISENFIPLLFSAFFIASFLELIINKEDFFNLDFVSQSNLIIFLLVMLVSFVLIIFIGSVKKLQIKSSLALLISVICFSLVLIIKSVDNLMFTIGVIFLNSIVFYYVMKDDKLNLDKIKLSNKVLVILITTGFIIGTYFVIKYTIIRYQTFTASTFDFGIFAQMFEYLAKTGIPFTTLEADKFLTHFAVHFSPIYYLLLPGYYLFRSPIYLLIVQAISIFSGVFPIYLICKNKKINNIYILLISFIYLLYPALTAGAFWDFHENKLLTVLLLWMIYFLEKENNLLMYIFMFLVLMVKEDAALYVIFIGLYKMLYNKKAKPGIYILIIGIVYFVFAISMISFFGGSLMSYRFANYFSPGSSGLLSIFKTVFLNFGFFINEIMNYKKIEYFICMLLPLMFLPFINKKISNLILLIPLLVINLMPSYPYQYNIDFQYTYGVAALLFYSLIINVKESKVNVKRILLTLAFVSSLYLYITLNYSKYSYFNTESSKKIHIKTRNCLDTIPFDATITASTFFTSYLSNREIVYMYPSIQETDYIVLSLFDENIAQEERDEFLLYYEKTKECGDVVIYQKINN